MPKYHFRAGVGGFSFYRGMTSEGDPSAEPYEEFRWLQNMRVTPDGLFSRPGQAKRFSTLVGPISGIYEASDVRAPGTEYLVPPLPTLLYEIGATATDYRWFSYYTPNGAIPTQIYIPGFRFLFFARPFKYQRKLVIGTYVPVAGEDNILYQWSPTYGLTVAYRNTTPYVGTNKGQGFFSGVEFEGNFYTSVFWHNQAVYPHNEHLLIYRWDGLTDPVLEYDHADFVHPGSASITIGVENVWALYTDGLAVWALCKTLGGYHVPGNQVRKRTPDGVWATVPLVSCTYFGASSLDIGVAYGGMVRFNNETYICGNDYNAEWATATQKTLKILKYSESPSQLSPVWTRANTPYGVGSSGDPSYISMFVSGGKLYYNYTDNAAGVYKTGSFDGTTWNDNFKTWTDAPQSLAYAPLNVVEADGSLWAAANGKILKTAGLAESDISGLWATITHPFHGRYLDVS